MCQNSIKYVTDISELQNERSNFFQGGNIKRKGNQLISELQQLITRLIINPAQEMARKYLF